MLPGIPWFAVSPSPRIGRTPTASKKFVVTAAPGSRTLSPPSASVIDPFDVARDLLESARLLPPVLEVRGRDVVARLRVQPIVLPDRHEAAGIAERQRAQQHGVDDREDGGVGADAERERQHDDRGETGALAHQAQRIAKILEQHVETPLLAEEAPRVGDRADRPGHHPGVAAPRIAAAVLPGGGELGLPLGAELAARAAGGESRDDRDETAEEIRHGGCRGGGARGSRSVSWRRRARRCRPW